MASMAAMGGFGEGIGQAMPNLLKLSGMQQQQNQFQEQQAMDERKVRIVEASEKRQKEEYDRGNTPWSVDDYLAKFPQFSDKTKGMMRDTVRMSGLIENAGGQEIIRQKNVKEAFKLLSDPKTQLNLSMSHYQDLGEQYNGLKEQIDEMYQKERETGAPLNEKKYQQLAQGMDKLSKEKSRYGAQIEGFKKLIAPAKVDTSISETEALLGKGVTPQEREDFLQGKERLSKPKLDAELLRQQTEDKKIASREKIAKMAGEYRLKAYDIINKQKGSKDTRSTLMKEYDFYLSQEEEADREPIAFQEWMDKYKSKGKEPKKSIGSVLGGESGVQEYDYVGGQLVPRKK